MHTLLRKQETQLL